MVIDHGLRPWTSALELLDHGLVDVAPRGGLRLWSLAMASGHALEALDFGHGQPRRSFSVDVLVVDIARGLGWTLSLSSRSAARSIYECISLKLPDGPTRPSKLLGHAPIGNVHFGPPLYLGK